jgi:periplasmic protein TonB
MESSTILTADILDIIFEGRNKAYGAYDLRRTYGRRLTVSITVMLSVSLLLGIGFAFAGEKKEKLTQVVLPPDVELKNIQEETPEPPPPPPPPKLPVPQVQVLQFTPPRIVNEEVKEDEKPPEMETLEDTKIGTMNVEGIKDDGIVAPPIDAGTTGVIVAPKKDEDDIDKTFTKVEIESDYPGGFSAWKRFLERNLRFSQEAIDNQVQGTVVVQFIVDREGNVSDVQAISGPQEHYAEAVRVIKKSGKWTPAIQNGRQVKSFKKQPIVFRLETEG